MSEELDLPVVFHFEDIEFELIPEEKYTTWVHKMAEVNKVSIEAINYIFCSDEYLLDINRNYLQHDYYTDIISFPYHEKPNPLQGDIFISIDRVKENAADLKIDFNTELLRVISHGLLHFCGFKDKTSEDQQIMREKEEEMMNLF
ncbi:rRNA maturation RNase YbeY [Portibacter lacus]|uniref:Endoribonuclease YbeY n=1 Tax=Portibacter lacus TaxID=1099794 RepID=A0AA37SQ61_9BACT|nr:rRNA maturation RNase YbeY [Portibacter lacus]GLR18916.1 endoribonuclease YbeY [Portibacter lacus]